MSLLMVSNANSLRRTITISSPSYYSPFVVDPCGNDAYGGTYRKAVVKHERATVNQM